MCFAKPSIVSCSRSRNSSGQSVAQIGVSCPFCSCSVFPKEHCYRLKGVCTRETILCVTSNGKFYPEVLFQLKFPSVRAMQVRSSLNSASVGQCVCPSHWLLITKNEANTLLSGFFEEIDNPPNY